MNIGIPREIRPFEYRVGLSPAGVEILCQHGHTVFVEHKAGNGAGFPDKEYEQAGAKIVYSPEEAYGRADLVLKIARPTEVRIAFPATRHRAGRIIESPFCPPDQDRIPA